MAKKKPFRKIIVDTTMIVTDLKKLTNPIPLTDFESGEAEALASALFDQLDEEGGLGLSANQVGEMKRLCVLNVKDRVFLTNPEIVERSEERFTYYESCLSIPKTRKKPLKTERHQWVKVRADNLPEDIIFGPDNMDAWDEDPLNFWSDIGFLQAVVVQHEIDHLDGITIKDRVYSTTVVSDKQYGRNEKVMFFNPSNGDVEFLKFKYGQHLLNQGWIVK